MIIFTKYKLLNHNLPRKDGCQDMINAICAAGCEQNPASCAYVSN